jgi:hypothetical protein
MATPKDGAADRQKTKNQHGRMKDHPLIIFT